MLAYSTLSAIVANYRSNPSCSDDTFREIVLRWAEDVWSFEDRDPVMYGCLFNDLEEAGAVFFTYNPDDHWPDGCQGSPQNAQIDGSTMTGEAPLPCSACQGKSRLPGGFRWGRMTCPSCKGSGIAR